MPRFFVHAGQIIQTEEGLRVTILGADAHHISRSLRMAAGEEVVLCPLDGPNAGVVEYRCTLTAFPVGAVEARVEEICPARGEPPYFARLFVALSKADKLESIMQKAVECGAGEIIPFVSSRCVARPGDSEERKRERRMRIAAEAAGQCGRSRIPAVREPLSYAAMLKEAVRADLPLFFYEGEGTVSLPVLLSDCARMPESVSLVVGAEGGFSLEEVQMAQAAGLYLAGLGRRILRCETAPIFALSCLSYAFELNQNNTK